MTTDTIVQTQPDIYTRITDKIIAGLEKGQFTWRQPWDSAHLSHNVMRPLRSNDQPYTGINVLVLWATAAEKGYSSPYWMTLKQASFMKASIRKGEKATQVVYADKMDKTEPDENGELKTRQVSFLKSYHVFNASQIEGLPAAFYKTPEPKYKNPEERIASLETFFANTKAEIFTGTLACYNMTRDQVEMPPFEIFDDASSFYATLAHELTHWTKHPKRLDRSFGSKQFGDDGYAKEELVAEIGSCFLAADLGIEPVFREDHVAYIQNWLSVLKNDKRFIFTAASQAQKAVEYLKSPVVC